MAATWNGNALIRWIDNVSAILTAVRPQLVPSDDSALEAALEITLSYQSLHDLVAQLHIYYQHTFSYQVIFTRLMVLYV